MIFAICAVAVAFGFFGSMPLAGPIAVMVVARAAQKRYGEALRIGFGAAAAEGIYAGVAFFGFATLLARHPIVVPVSLGMSGVVLIALGGYFALWRPMRARDAHSRESGTALVGFTISALNPTLLITWSTAVAFLYSKGLGASSALAAIPFGLGAAVGVGGWFALFVYVLRRFEGKLPERLFTWTIRVLGCVLVGLGAWSGVQLVAWLRR